MIQDVYPVGGEKQMPMNAPWPQTVINAQQPHLCSSPDEIKATYNDHETILKLGSRCVYCIPIIAEDGTTLGSLNFSGTEEQCNQRTLEGMKRLAKEEAVTAFQAVKHRSI